jgi:hypothetical protein
MKKLISLAIVLIMTFGLTGTAFGTDTALTDAQLESAVEAVAGALVDADEDATIKANSALLEAVADEAETPEDVADFFSKIVFVEKSEVEAVSQKIADSCKYRITTIENEKKTVYVAVDLRTCYEIFDARVFLNATKKIFAKCKELAIADGMAANPDAYTLMEYSHLAGELAMHMILTDISNDMGGSKEGSWLNKIYNMSVVSELNVDESRVNASLIRFFGNILVSLLDLFF